MACREPRTLRPVVPLILTFALIAACSCDLEDIGRMSGELWIGRTVVDFGRVCLGDEVELAIAVENRGPITLRFEDVLVSGGSGADRFRVVDYPSELERAGRDGAAGYILIAFEPQGASAVFTGLHIRTDEVERPERELSLRGEGDDGPRTEVVFTCESQLEAGREDCRSVMFGEIGVGAMGEQEVHLENRGCAVLTVDSLDHNDTLGTGEPDVFGLDAPEAPFTLSNREPTSIKVRITPSREDAFVGRVEVVWRDTSVNGDPEVTSVNVVAQGVDLNLVVQPSHFTFGQATVDSPQMQTFAVRNLGGRAGVISAIELGDGVDVFSVEPEGALPLTIPGLEVVNFDVTYAPTEASQDRDVVLVHTDVGVLRVPIMGGVLPQIEVDPPQQVDFGWVEAGESALRRVVVSNVGQANLNVSDVLLDMDLPDVFTLQSFSSPLPVVLEPGQNLEFDVLFQDHVGIANEIGQLSIENDDPGYEQGGYLLELRTENERVNDPQIELEVLADGDTEVSPINVREHETVTFDASGSSSHDGSSLQFTWSLMQRPAPASAEPSSTTGAVVTLAPDYLGLWKIRLTVTDRFGLSAWEEVDLNVIER